MGRTIRPEVQAILQNRNVIDINQDKLGHQGRRVMHDTQNHLDIFVKRILPWDRSNQYNSGAAAIMYRGTSGTPANVTVSPEDVGLMDNCGYMTLDAFTGKDLGKVSGAQRVSYMVNPSGVRLIRFEVDNC